VAWVLIAVLGAACEAVGAAVAPADVTAMPSIAAVAISETTTPRRDRVKNALISGSRYSSDTSDGRTRASSCVSGSSAGGSPIGEGA
jgi:hypothetical protein